jgi:MocE subfamily Rieske [2Fe-2S] domain protein
VRVVTAVARPAVDGWIEVCGSALLRQEDVLRFDYGGQVYAVYRTIDNRVYATDGICTHGNAQLASGLVIGKQIECPKHNGRFDLRDGSPQRPPVCVGLKTYDVRERDGRIHLNVNSAHGAGVEAAPPTYTFRVVSNDNVATFIKELVLDPDGAAPALVYQPGEYLQFDIPAYAERSLRDVDIRPPYAGVWQAQGVYDIKAANPLACRRSYSMATNPAAERQLRFNVRIATPPRGVDCSAGVGSAYLFSLRPGDRISASGPFGTFHIKPSEREMVYLGGGSGMAPLRSHLSYLLETQKTARRISYWYGARSLGEVFYGDYFAGLAAQNPNFTFHLALSEPQPEDRWTGSTGFIHEVLEREYLDGHPDPTQIEFYLCGPLAMIRAASRMLGDLGVSPSQIASDEF